MWGVADLSRLGAEGGDYRPGGVIQPERVFQRYGGLKKPGRIGNLEKSCGGLKKS